MLKGTVENYKSNEISLQVQDGLQYRLKYCSSSTDCQSEIIIITQLIQTAIVME